MRNIPLSSFLLTATLGLSSVLHAQGLKEGIDPNKAWLGLVGDSGITGAATSEDLHATIPSLGSTVLGLLYLLPENYKNSIQIADIKRIPQPERFGLAGPRLEPLKRVLYSTDELSEVQKDGTFAAWGLKAGGRGSLRLDVSEYSYGYLTARALGIPAKRIVLVAQDGQRVDSIYKQLKRFGEIAPTLPSHIFISYSANDMCGDELDNSLEAFSANFRKVLEREFKLATDNLKPHPTLGTKVVVMAPLDVPQILTNKALFAQTIFFQGTGEVTCGDIRYKRAALSKTRFNLDSSQGMQKTLVGECRAIFSTSPDDDDSIARIAQFQQEQIRIYKEVLGAIHVPGWSFELSEAVRKPVFATGDIAHDCFHPGPGAHAKIAEDLLSSLSPDFMTTPVGAQK